MRSEMVIARATAGRAARSGALWGAVFGLTVVSTALGYSATFPTAASRAKLAASLFLATALVTGAAVFLAVGALVSQLAATRRQANGIAAGVLGASFLLRMVADSGARGLGGVPRHDSLAWLRWASPLGWAEE